MWTNKISRECSIPMYPNRTTLPNATSCHLPSTQISTPLGLRNRFFLGTLFLQPLTALFTQSSIISTYLRASWSCPSFCWDPSSSLARQQSWLASLLGAGEGGSWFVRQIRLCGLEEHTKMANKHNYGDMHFAPLPSTLTPQTDMPLFHKESPQYALNDIVALFCMPYIISSE